MATNQFLPFCATDTGTNLPTQGDYAADPNRDIGNSPGIASSKLNNKPLRQATAIASQLAQYVANKNDANVIDDGNMPRLLAQINATFMPLPPVVTTYLSGSGTHALTYVFFIATGSATAGATYTHNSVTYTVKETVSSGVILRCTGGASLPTGSAGVLTRATGTGDNTINFYAYRIPISLTSEICGGGGGGGGSGTGTPPSGGAGGNTTFGSSLLTANGGAGGTGNSGASGAGGTGTVQSPAVGIAIPGSRGYVGWANTGATGITYQPGGNGGINAFGGGGAGGTNAAGTAGTANSGSGGGGGGGSAASNVNSGGGGGAGAYVRGTVNNPTSNFPYSVGAAGTAGAIGTNGYAGGAGAAGIIIVYEEYQ